MCDSFLLRRRFSVHIQDGSEGGKAEGHEGKQESTGRRRGEAKGEMQLPVCKDGP